MLNTFPQLLTFSFFAPLLLRVAVAVAIAYIVYIQFKNREAIAEMRTVFIGKVGGLIWIVKRHADRLCLVGAVPGEPYQTRFLIC